MPRIPRTPKSQNELAKVGIPCPDCGYHFEQTVAWFQANDVATCGACDRLFSLRTKKTQTLIKQLSQIGDTFDAPSKKRS